MHFGYSKGLRSEVNAYMQEEGAIKKIRQMNVTKSSVSTCAMESVWIYFRTSKLFASSPVLGTQLEP